MILYRMLAIVALAWGACFCLFSFCDASEVRWAFDKTWNQADHIMHCVDHEHQTLDLSSVGSTGFTVLSHPAFPNYRIRMKRADFCDHTVRSFTGYIDIEARHFFFSYFESRSNPAEDDVILWLNGGPGGSSFSGLFMELGPCTITGKNSTVFNPYSWNSKANLLFVEQPIGVTLSYTEHGESVKTTEEAAVDIAAFLAIFFESIEGLEGRPLHIAGESYGGRYVPLFAAEVYDQNGWLRNFDMRPINLSSIIIGNGLSSPYSMMLSYYDMACTNASGLQPLQSISVCMRMKQAIPRCEIWLRKACEDVWDAMDCSEAHSFCSTELQQSFLLTGRSFYDMSTECIGNVEETLCYPETMDITAYLNLNTTREILGIEPWYADLRGLVGVEVNSAFTVSHDTLQASNQYIEALLERNVIVLVYAGAYDFVCNWVGNDAMTKALNWSGQAAFNRQLLRNWYLGEKIAGKTRSSGGLTFASVYGAGHMVPHDKPEEALILLTRWLGHKPF